MVTVIVKASFALVQDELATVAEAPRIRTKDEHDGGQPMRSLRGARETAPQLRQVDVLLTGHAYAPEGGTQTKVRLALANDAGTLLDKSIMVYGDRSSPNATPKPFTRLKLGYEHALGGIGHNENPLGTGVGACADTPPNLVHPSDPSRTAVFGPIPASFPSRKKLLGNVRRAVLEQAVVEIPAELDWSYLQCAPVDQRVETIRGGEWLLLENLHPIEPLIRARLPITRAVTKVYGHDAVGAPEHIPLIIDMLHIEPDVRRCSLVWRGSFPVLNEQGLSQLLIAGALATPGQKIAWPASAAELADVASPDPASSRDQGGPESSDERGVATTHARSSEDEPEHDYSSTMLVDPSAAMDEAGLLPFQKSSSPSQQPSGPERSDSALPFKAQHADSEQESPFEGTFALSASQLADLTGTTSPFEIAEPSATGSDSAPDSVPAQSIPGAPWAHQPAAEVATPHFGAETVEVGLDVGAMLREHDERTQELSAKSEAETKAQKQARLEAEQAALAEIEERARAEAEAAEEREAAARARDEAEARRKLEAERFRAEQEAAKKEAERREREKAKEKQDAAKKLRSNMYGGFKRNKR